MPSKKKKYNARFPAGRIKKIMQTDEEVGKVAQAVPVIISRTLELFVESLLTKSMQITQARNAKTLTPSHMKQCILSESRFDFLKDLVKNVPDPSAQEDNENDAVEAIDYSMSKKVDETEHAVQNLQEIPVEKPEFIDISTLQSTSAARTPVIQYSPKVSQTEPPKINFSIESLVSKPHTDPKIQIDLAQISLMPSTSHLPIPHLVPTRNNKLPVHASCSTSKIANVSDIPPLIPISHSSIYGHNSGDNNLYIDEDYDN